MRKILVVSAAALFMSAFAASAQNAPSAPSSTTPSASKPAPSAGQAAARERQKKCAAEWKEAKAAGKIEKGTTWPKYWSACNTRLKGA
ncbi:MAG TPA: hypothetical protein VFB45_06525 [Pseudolabrys sp.]|nr:hypothetical protein [Pseudolabrys sp.]